jgi:hypothetical protein
LRVNLRGGGPGNRAPRGHQDNSGRLDTCSRTGLRAAPLQVQVLPQLWAFHKELQKEGRGGSKKNERGAMDEGPEFGPLKADQ